MIKTLLLMIIIFSVGFLAGAAWHYAHTQDIEEQSQDIV